MKKLFTYLMLLAALATTLNASIPLKGANGKVIDFAGIFKATPQTLHASMTVNYDTIQIGWNSLDLNDLQANHPDIYEAYEQAKLLKQDVMIKKGIYDGVKSYDEYVDELRNKLTEIVVFNITRKFKRIARQDEDMNKKYVRNPDKWDDAYTEAMEKFYAGNKSFVALWNRRGLSYVRMECSLYTFIKTLNRTSGDELTTFLLYARKNPDAIGDLSAFLIELSQDLPSPAFNPQNPKHEKFVKAVNNAIQACDDLISKEMDRSFTARSTLFDLLNVTGLDD